MTAAIIGLGNIGSKLAANFAAGGERVILADHSLSKAERLAGQIGANAIAMSFDAAINDASTLILAIPFEAIQALVSSRGTALAGKIVVDPSNPIAPDGKGGFKKTIAPGQSAGEIIAGLLPEGVPLVKAFGTLSAESLGSGANRKPEKATLFYATDDPEAGRVVAGLIASSGFSPMNVGKIAQSLRIEVGGDLHELGALGKLVSKAEAEKLV